MTKMLKSIIAGAAVLIGACFIGQTQPVQAADDYALRLAEDNQWYYYQDDEVDTAYQGLALNEYGWWYVSDGTIDWDYAGMALNDYGWWYVSNGTVDFNYTGMALNEYGWWYFNNGVLDLSYTGMALNDYGWWYFNKGHLDLSYTGMARNEYGWWYFDNGMLDLTYTGMACNKYGWWYFTDGLLDLEYYGLGENEYGLWLYEDGRINFNYRGSITDGSQIYIIQKGYVTEISKVRCNLDPNDPYYNYEYAYRTGDTSVIKTDEQEAFFEGLSACLDAAFEYNTLFEQEKAVHDYMVLNSAYDYESYQNGTVPEVSHTAEGIFVYKTAVCDGYAGAFKLCMDILGIPCETITGTAGGIGHAWNAVMLDDEWYMVDVTWDDPVPDTPGQVLYGYFNITDEKMRQDHTYTSDITADGTKYYYLGMQENYFTDAEIDDYYAYISEKASETSGNVTITAMVESTDQEIDSEWLGTFTDSGRLEISYRELSLSVQWSGHIATFTWTLKR